jgi:hypothetical protein
MSEPSRSGIEYHFLNIASFQVIALVSGSVAKTVDDFVRQLAALDPLSVQRVAYYVDVQQVRSISAPRVAGSDRPSTIVAVANGVYRLGPEGVLGYECILGIPSTYSRAVFEAPIAVYLVVRNPRFPVVSLIANPLEANAFSTVVHNEVRVREERTMWNLGIITFIVAPDPIALVVMNVGVLDIEFIGTFDPGTDIPECTGVGRRIR